MPEGVSQIENSNKSSDQAAKSNSFLFKLWGKRAAQTEEVPDANKPAENTSPEIQPVQVPVISAEKGDLQLLWEKWCGGEPASAFMPMEYVEDIVQSVSLEEAMVDDVATGKHVEQPHRKELLHYRNVLEEAAERMLAQARRLAIAQEEALRREELIAAKAEALRLIEQGEALEDTLAEYENALKELEENLDLEELLQKQTEPCDADVHLFVSKDKLGAWIFVFPPANGGADITERKIRELLTQEGIVYGINTDAVKKLCDEFLYFKMIEIAHGEAAIDGKDGEVIDCMPRETKFEIKQDENGNADYKNMNLIRNILKGEAVYKITYPTEPVSGADITGKKLNGKMGNPPRIPKSTGIELSEDGFEVVAAYDGQITYKDDKFVVEKVLTIEGDVDSSTGNIEFNGDITIQGDVREGFRVKAKGNITVRGMVENADIISGGGIIIEKGMNGNGTGALDAQGDIKCKFMENCTAVAGGSIYAGSVICSNIFCTGELTVTSGKGVIIGGVCTVNRLLEARVIGSKSNRSTVIVMGNTPSMINKKMDLETQLGSLRASIDAINKDMAYLEAKGDSITADRKAAMSQMKLKKPLLLMQEKQLEKQIEKLAEEMEDVSASRIKCGTVYPPTKITIGKAKMVVEEVHNRCNIYYSEGEIVIGMQ